MAKDDFEDFLSRITFAESRGKRTDSSGKLLEGPMTKYGTAKGELQVLDSTNKRPGYGIVPAKDETPDERARVGRDYLKAMLDKFKDKRTAAIAYNWGPGNTQKWLDAGADEAGLPLETQNYVKKVMGTGAAVAKAPAPPDMAPAPRQAAGAPSVPGAPANRPVVSRETVGPGTVPAEDRLSALGPSYQAAMALSYLADTTNPAPQEEDEDGELRISGDEPRSTAREDDDVTNFLMEPSARTALADFDFKIQSPFAERPVKRMAGGGDPSRSVLGAQQLQRPSESYLRQQYPEVYGGLTGFMGIAPDEMGGSILDPNTARVRAGAEYGFPVGTAAQVIPAMGLLAPAVKATAKAISTATPGPASGSRAAQLGVVKLPGGNFIKGNYPGSVEHSLDRSLLRSWGLQQGAPVDDWINNTLVKYIKTDMGTSRDPVRLGIESRIAKAEADKLVGQKRIAKMQADIEKAKAGGKNTELSEERMRQEIERQELAYESSVKHVMHMDTGEGALQQRDARRSLSDFPVAVAEAKTPASSIWETATDYAIGKPPHRRETYKGYPEEFPQYAEDYSKKPYGLYKDAPDLRPTRPKDPFGTLIQPGTPGVKDIWNAFKERFGPIGRSNRANLEANREIGRVADRANYEGRIEENPWLATVPPKTPVYSYETPQFGYTNDPARFSVLVRELKNAMNPESGLPAELLLKTMPKTMDDAVAHVGKINAWREFNFTPKQMAASNNSATFFVKDYPDAGLKWVELKLPNMSEVLPEGWTLNKSGNTLSAVSDEGAYVSGSDLPNLIKNLYKEHPNTLGREDALKEALKFEGGTMKHCVGEADCEALAMGNKRIFSLRDSKERPHVTIEVKPLSEENPQLYITQIRGPANSKPKTKYDPQVQDFVLGNEFGVSADMRNVDFLDKFLSNTYNKSTAQYIKTMDEGLTADEIKTIFREQENVPGMADGGEARQMLEKLLPNRAKGSPEEGEVSQEELDAASKPSFKAQSSGMNRQRGPISDALASGEAYTAAAKGFTNFPYNLAGGAMDLAMIVRQGLTGQAPAGQVGTSEYIKNKMTEFGIRQAPPTDPTLKGFYELGDLGSNLVNPAAPVRGAVKVAEKTGEAAKMLAKTIAEAKPGPASGSRAAQLGAVRVKGTPVVMSPSVREPTPDIMTDNFLLSMDKTGENAFFAKYPDIASWEYKQIRNTPEFKNFSASFLAPRDEVTDLLDRSVTQILAPARIGGPPVSVDPALNNWFLKTFSRYLRSDFASPSDQLVRAADEGKLLHLAPKELWFDDDANRELVKYLGSKQSDLKNTREAEGFPRHGMAKTDYGERIEDLTDLSAYPESIEDLSPFKVPISMRGLVATNPETRAMDFSPDMVKNLKLEELRDTMLEIRQSGGQYSAYGQPAVKIPPEFLLPDDTLAKLNVAAASNRVARFTGWQEEARQGMATTALRTDPRFRRDLSSDGKYISVFIPDLAKPANQELIGIVTDVGCDGGWCTMREGNALGYGSGKRSLSIVLTNDGKKARPVAQVSVESRGIRGSSIVDIAGKNNSYDFANNPALPVIQEHVKELDYIYGGLEDIAYLKQLEMMQIPRESPAKLMDLFSPTFKRMNLLRELYGGTQAENLRKIADEAAKLNKGSYFVVGNEDTVGELLMQALQNLTTPQKRATGGFMERQSNDNRKYL